MDENGVMPFDKFLFSDCQYYGSPLVLGLITTKDGNPLGLHAHGRKARGQADHEELAYMFCDFVTL